MSESVAAPPPAAEAPAAKPVEAAVDPAIRKAAIEAEQIRQRGIAIRQQRAEAAKKQAEELAATKARAAELEAKARRYEEFERKLLEDPDAALKATPLGDKWYESITKAKLGDTSDVQVKALREELRQEIAALKSQDEQREAARKAQEEQRSAEAKAADEREEAEYAEELLRFVKSEESSKKYQTLHALGIPQAVVQKARSVAEAEGKLLSEQEAADAAEAEMDGYIRKALSTDKWREIIKSEFMPKLDLTGNSRFEARRPRSIGNDMAAGIAKAPPAKAARLTPEQKRANAIARLEELTSKP